MTGFARVRKTADAREAIVSVKSVNHRGLDVHFRMAPELDAFESSMRAVVKRRVERGHVQVQAQVNANNPEAADLGVVNAGLIDAYITAFRRMSAIHGLHNEPDLNSAFRISGVFQIADAEPDPALESILIATLEEAVERLNEFRAREGAEIAAEMQARVATALRGAQQMEQIRARAVPEFHARLSQRLADLLKDVAIDPQRLAQEVAYLADRSDITEELTRLKVHAVQVHDLLAGGGAIGKKLDFLLQELHRETNTILSKTTGAGEAGIEITDLALTTKAEIEKIREQGLNLE